MLNLTKISIKRPVMIKMIFISIAIIGIISWFKIPVELLPNIKVPVITVMTEYSNITSNDVESLVTIPMEEAFGTIEGLRNIDSYSMDGLSIVHLKFFWGTNLDIAAIDVKEKTNLIKSNLPNDLGHITVTKYDPMASPLITIGVFKDDLSDNLDQKLINNIKNIFERIPGVGVVKTLGENEHEIIISVDQSKLYAYQLSISDVVRKVQQSNFDFPGGEIKRGTRQFRIRTIGQFKNISDILNVTVSISDSGSPIYLKDIASVSEEVKEASGSFSVDDSKGIGISIYNTADSNAVEVSEAIEDSLKKIQYSIYPGLKFIEVFDKADYIKNSITSLKWTLVFGGFLAFCVLALFLKSISIAFVIILVIPVSILSVFFLMYISNISLNLMSLGGLALGVGILVDNGIVILENIVRKENNSGNFNDAIVKGSHEIQNPIIASTFAQIIVFAPIFFVKEITAKIFLQLAITICFSMLFSVFISLMLTPVLLSQIAQFRSNKSTNKKRKLLLEKKSLNHYNNINSALSFKFTENLERLYLKVIEYLLKYRKILLISSIIITIIGFSLTRLLDKKLFPTVRSESFIVQVELPIGSPISKSIEVSHNISNYIKSNYKIKNTITEIGYNRKDILLKSMPNSSSNISRIRVIKSNEFKYDIENIGYNITKILNDKNIKISIFNDVNIFDIFNENNSSPEIIELKGNNYYVLESLAKKLITELNDRHILNNFDTNYPDLIPEIQLNIHSETASLYGISNMQIADTLHNSIEGEIASLFKINDTEIPIRVKLKNSNIDTIEKLKNIFIESQKNYRSSSLFDEKYTNRNRKIRVRLQDVADINYADRFSHIFRRNNEKTIIISGDYNDDIDHDSNNIIRSIIDKTKLPINYSASLSEAIYQKQKTFGTLLKMIGVSIFLIYIMLSSFFESIFKPFIIMISIPFSFMGPIFALIIFGLPISLGVYIGFIMLGGIAANNSILLVDSIDRYLKLDKNISEAILSGACSRLRPIIMTATTTIIALLPLAINRSSGFEFSSPLALTVISGIISTSIMTLIVIPVLYFTIIKSNLGFWRWTPKAG
jgi:HAE1 family hydrophobic/amphiphilic exporter-1